MIDDARPVDVRRHMFTIVLVLGGGEDQAHADASGHLDRLQHALALGEPAEEQQVVVGLRLKRERVGVDAVQHDVDDVQAGKEAGLLHGNRDERRLGIALPQPNLGLARRVMQRLHDRRGRQPRERERHRVVGRLVMNDVELVRALDRRGEVQHLVELPRPHVLVVPVAVLVDGVQLGCGLRVGGGEERDVVAARHEAFGQERRHQLNRARLVRRHFGGDRGDVRDAQWSCVHAHACSRSGGSTRRASKCSRAMSAAIRAWRS